MKQDRDGKLRHLGGKLQEEAGELLGDREMQAEGKLRQVEGEAEQDLARAREQVEEAAVRRASARRTRKSR